MAKLGEGDPRWLVESREDGKNVNNWHWSETDCMNFAKKRLEALLCDLSFLDDENIGWCKTTTVDHVSGECTVNIRKGKTIFYYEIDSKICWEGEMKGADVKVKGHLTLPYISEENDDDKNEVKASVEGSGPAHDRLLDLVKAKGIPLVQQRVAQFLKELREEYTVKKPPAETQASESPQQMKASQSPQQMKAPEPEVKKAFKEVKQGVTATSSASASSLQTKTIKIKEQFNADPNNALINPQMLNAITQGSAKMDPTEGGRFSLFGDTITGVNVKLVPGSKIVQKWRFKEWPEGHFSTVTIDLKEKEGTKLELMQEGVPAGDVERTERGWIEKIFARAKMTFGFGPAFF